MSKITPKNLSYDTSLPPFLQRMQAASSSSSRDGRHEFSVARPKRARNEDEEREDEPVYFDEESGETLTKGEWEAREEGKESKDGEGGEGGGEKGDEDADAEQVKNDAVKEKEKLAAIGSSKKRKVGKIVGAEEEADAGAGFTAEQKKVIEKGQTEKGKGKKGDKEEQKSKGKKAKKIKLSFGDDE
ncbi:hypothetical protein BP6252_00817 [Coleophoma cylindrospora]|uniref:DUF4604 domain-containing protein n=1 Tax=Coleophoma cylindrospora TaxID=1849047 RepID=A0A3D8SR52_9HELO|nr:hypothetical protein BP6252_00817 [Coleophoma cylindrospora]